MRIILASQSPRRLEILRSVVPEGAALEAMPANIDEKAIRKPKPDMLTLAIARAKGEAVRKKLDGDGIIVAADTVVICNTRLRGKPADRLQLQHWLETYRRFPANVITSVWVHRLSCGWSGTATESATVLFSRFSDADIGDILRRKEFYGAAGGFIIDHPLMSAKVAEVSGGDNGRSTVQGLPVQKVRQLLNEALAAGAEE